MDVILSAEEIKSITGYSYPARQVRALKAMGFIRARLSADNRCILERPHYEAVCAARDEHKRPEVTPRVANARN